ncbi:MAG: TetR/AcrR family transcriptional regulator [Acidimicrobiia bacterium]
MPKAVDQSTKDRILDAAIGEIAQRGWSGVRSRGIAKRAGVNNALVHYHFGSMERLLIAAAGKAIVDIDSDLGPPPPGSSLADVLSHYARAEAEYDLDDPRGAVLLEALLHSPRVGDVAQIVGNMLDQYRSVTGDAIATGVQEGELSADTDREGLAIALVALLDGLALHRYLASDLDIERAVSAITDLWKPAEEEK